MNILTLWVWAFWFAILKTLWENNPRKKFYAYEVNPKIVSQIKKNRTHPFFFPWHTLPNNVELIRVLKKHVKEADVIIIAIPAQYIRDTITNIKDSISPNTTLINLAKWIDNKSLKTISWLIKSIIKDKEYDYWILSGWMIAKEVVEKKQLWADLAITNISIWKKLKEIFESETLKIQLLPENYIVNVELYWSLKNILAILIGYHEWKWESYSTIWYHLTNWYNECKKIVEVFWWDPNIDFWQFSLWWDIIATCFWNSRNRYLGNLLGSDMQTDDALQLLKNENKHAEWYENIKSVHKLIKDKDWFENCKFLYTLITK